MRGSKISNTRLESPFFAKVHSGAGLGPLFFCNPLIARHHQNKTLLSEPDPNGTYLGGRLCFPSFPRGAFQQV
jgi:hypothetical protein